MARKVQTHDVQITLDELIEEAQWNKKMEKRYEVKLGKEDEESFAKVFGVLHTS